VVSYDGQRVFFAGKAGAAGEWQIYQEDLAGGHPQMLTSMPGGAMKPGAASERKPGLRFAGAKNRRPNYSQPPSALYVQSPAASRTS